jgi:hypothetical protein
MKKYLLISFILLIGCTPLTPRVNQDDGAAFRREFERAHPIPNPPNIIIPIPRR